ncbi:MAG TPA: hypothetical protein VJR69_12225 [Nitrospira sp.]|nr:hypothetical protein [Nitrospira sp.]
MDITILGAWVATGLTLFIFSFLYKDNPLFKLAEHLYVGVSVGYIIVKTCDSVVVNLIYKPIVEQGEFALLVPVAIGLLMLTRYVPKAAWMSRYAFAFIVGVGSGLAIPRTISSFILKQVEDTVRSLLVVPLDKAIEILLSSRGAFSFIVLLMVAMIAVALYVLVRLGFSRFSQVYQLAIIAILAGGIYLLKYLNFTAWLFSNLAALGEVFDINSFIVLLGVGCVLFYFFFSIEHSGPGKVVARTGIYFLMIAFGAAFGYTVMARMSLLIGRLTDLIEFSDPSYGRPTLWLVPITVAALMWLGRRESPPRSE